MSAARGGGSAGSQGFILVEILVALSIVAVMAALMAGVLGQLRAVGNVKEQVLARSELSAAASHLQRTLAGTRVAYLADPESGDPTDKVFEGQSGQMRFAAVTRQGFYSLALREVRIFVERDGGGLHLMQALAPRRPQGGDALETTLVILENVDGVSFEYSRDGVSYTASWTAAGALPLTVRVTLSRRVGGKPVSASATARIL